MNLKGTLTTTGMAIKLSTFKKKKLYVVSFLNVFMLFRIFSLFQEFMQIKIILQSSVLNNTQNSRKLYLISFSSAFSFQKG